MVGSFAPALAAGDIDVELDSSAEGGHGIAGQVIGSVTSGRSVVIATSASSHASGEGGDATSANRLSIVDGTDDSRLSAVDRSADTTVGDGIGIQVTGAASVPSSTAQASLVGFGEGASDEAVLGSRLLFDIAP